MDHRSTGRLFCSQIFKNTHQEEPHHEKEHHTAAVTTKAAADSDVIYIPTDNTAASCTETIGSIVLNAKTPVVAGEKGLCTGCGVATLSISYYDLGYKTGEMAAQVLTGEADIAEMPVQYAPAAKMYNPTMCEALGITAPEGYEAME